VMLALGKALEQSLQDLLVNVSHGLIVEGTHGVYLIR
jgi:hypothetical protein